MDRGKIRAIGDRFSACVCSDSRKAFRKMSATGTSPRRLGENDEKQFPPGGNYDYNRSLINIYIYVLLYISYTQSPVLHTHTLNIT